MIVIEGLRYRYPGAPREALVAVSLTLSSRRVAVVGANGSGRTTLLKTISALALPTAGRIEVDGIAVREEQRWEVMRRAVYCPQDPDEQLSAMSVYGEVALPMLFDDSHRAQEEARVDAALKRLGIGALKRRFVGSLSVGEKKKVVLARTLVAESTCVLIDEPTAHLDPRSSREILRTIDGLAEDGLQIVLSTHILSEARSWAETVVILREGSVVAVGPSSLLMDEEVLERAGL